MEPNDEYRELVDELAAAGRGLQAALASALPGVRAEIDRIVADDARDTAAIEHLLDSLSDWRAWGVGEREYIRLVEYLKTYEPALAAYYWQRYDQDDESDE